MEKCTDERPCIPCFTGNGECEDQTKNKFIELSKPLVEFLRDNYHPHCHIVITYDSAELSEGSISFHINDFTRDKEQKES